MAGRIPLPTAADELPLFAVVDEVFLDFRRKSSELLDSLPATLHSRFIGCLHDLGREIRTTIIQHQDFDKARNMERSNAARDAAEERHRQEILRLKAKIANLQAQLQASEARNEGMTNAFMVLAETDENVRVVIEQFAAPAPSPTKTPTKKRAHAAAPPSAESPSIRTPKQPKIAPTPANDVSGFSPSKSTTLRNVPGQYLHSFSTPTANNHTVAAMERVQGRAQATQGQEQIMGQNQGPRQSGPLSLYNQYYPPPPPPQFQQQHGTVRYHRVHQQQTGQFNANNAAAAPANDDGHFERQFAQRPAVFPAAVQFVHAPSLASMSRMAHFMQLQSARPFQQHDRRLPRWDENGYELESKEEEQGSKLFK